MIFVSDRLLRQAFVFKIKNSQKALVADDLQESTQFGIHHFAGPVIYDASRFLERNSDTLPVSLISLMQVSTNTLIRKEMTSLLEEEKEGSSDVVKRKKTSILNKFRLQLKSLVAGMNESQVRYIRCIKPNRDLEPIKTDHVKLLGQMNCAGLVAAVELTRDIFPRKLTFRAVSDRFQRLMPSSHVQGTMDMMLHDRVQIMMSLLFASFVEQYRDSDFSMPYACGKTKVFFRSGALEYLDNRLLEFLSGKAETVQKSYRRVKAQREYQKLRRAVVLLQTAHRMAVCGSTYQKTKKGITLLQAAYRGKKECLVYATLQQSARSVQTESTRQEGAVRLQTWYRCTNTTKAFLTWRRGVVRVQTLIRSHLAAKRYLGMMRSLAVIQSFVLAVVARKRFLNLRDVTVVLQSRLRAGKASARCCREPSAFSDLSRRVGSSSGSSGDDGADNDDFDHLYENCDQRSFSDSPGEELSSAQTIDDSAHDSQVSGVSVLSSIATGGSQVLYSNQLDQLEEPPIILDSASVLSPHLSDSGSEHRKRIKDLKDEIMHITAEADMHTQEIAREFDDRLAEYENEVLELRKVIRQGEEEKKKLKRELKVVKESNVKAIQRLQHAIQETGNVRKECLGKIASVLDDANETRKTEALQFSKELELLKRDQNNKVRQLEIVIRQLEAAIHKQRSSKQNDPEEVHRLARKLERLFSSEHILAVLDRARQRPDIAVSIVEGSISSKCRRTLYCLEDIVRSGGSRQRDKRQTERRAGRKDVKATVEDRDDEAIGLQNQLVRAYEDIERLQQALERALTDSEHAQLDCEFTGQAFPSFRQF